MSTPTGSEWCNEEASRKGLDCLIMKTELDIAIGVHGEQGRARGRFDMLDWPRQGPMVLICHQHVISVETAYTTDRINHSPDSQTMAAK